MRELEALLTFCRQYDSIYCYGAGKYGRIVKCFLDEHELCANGFIVTKNVPSVCSVLNIPVVSLDEFVRHRPLNCGILVCISESYHRTITEELQRAGITDSFCISSELLEAITNETTFEHSFSGVNTINIFVYHRVGELVPDTWKLAVREELFEQQIAYICKHYKMVRAEAEWDDGDDSPKAVITFDDGYADVYYNALPILEKYQVPATVFVSTQNLNTDGRMWWDELERVIMDGQGDITALSVLDKAYKVDTPEHKEETCYSLHSRLKSLSFEERNEILSEIRKKMRPDDENISHYRLMSHDELRKLAESPLITIGGHTVTHSCLAAQSEQEQRWEIESSKGVLETILNMPVTVFSYPFGQKEDYNEITIQIAHDCGYKRVFAAFPGLTNAGFVDGNIPRNNIGQLNSIEETRKILHMHDILYGDGYV